MRESDEESLKKAEELCARLRTQLVERLDPVERKPGGKIRHLARVQREVLLHRAADLGEAACALFRQGRLVPAVTLTRSLFETAAAFYYVHKKMLRAIDDRTVDGIHDIIANGVWGSRNNSTAKKALQVMTTIDHMEKEHPGTRDEYEVLCEFAHPNMLGAVGSYAKYEKADLSVQLGINPEEMPLQPFGLLHLSISMEFALDYHERLASLDDQFKELVEALDSNRYID